MVSYQTVKLDVNCLTTRSRTDAPKSIARFESVCGGAPLNANVRAHGMIRLIPTLIFLLVSVPALAEDGFSSVRDAVQNIAGSTVSDNDFQSSSPTGECSIIHGVIRSEDSENVYDQIFVLNRTSTGKFKVAATSKKFISSRGPHHYLEFFQATRRCDRFYIQFNDHSNCGVGTRIYRFALIHEVWLVSGEEQTEPDVIACDVNFSSFHYSANFLTGDTNNTMYKKGKPVRTEKRLAKFPLYTLAEFDPEVLAGKPLRESRSNAPRP